MKNTNKTSIYDVLLRLPLARCWLPAPCACALMLGSPLIFAQSAASFPTKPLRIVMGFTPGGTSDLVARSVGQKLTEAWGQQVIVENRPDGASNIAAELVARAAPDGYTLLLVTVANTINVALYPKLAFDIVKDFAFVTNVATTPNIIVVNPALPARNVKELVAIAKSRPNELHHGSTGIGTPQHLAGEIFKAMAAVKMIHVPYKGAVGALTDVLAGQIEIFVGAVPSVVTHVESGRLRAIGVSSLKRAAVLPKVPTIDEQGLRGFETASWFGFAVPAATPRDVVSKLQSEMARGVTRPDFRSRMNGAGAEVIANSSEEYTAYIKSEIAKWGRAVKLSGATPG